jgi:hypothetical protein
MKTTKVSFDEIWEKIFGRIPTNIANHEHDVLRELCIHIANSYNGELLSRNQTSNLLRGIRRDYDSEDSAWRILLGQDNVTNFIKAVNSYQQIRGTFKSRDALPIDPMCLPLSNEKLYGKGLNSRVRD